MDLDEAQKLAAEIDRMLKRKGKRPRESHIIAADIAEKAGELAHSMRHVRGRGRSRERREIGQELADLLYSVCWIANSYGLHLNDYYRKKILNYLKKYGR